MALIVIGRRLKESERLSKKMLLLDDAIRVLEAEVAEGWAWYRFWKQDTGMRFFSTAGIGVLPA